MKHPIQEFLLSHDPIPQLTQGFPKGHSEDVLFPTVHNIRGKGGRHKTVSYSCCGLRSAVSSINQGCGWVCYVQKLGHGYSSRIQSVIIDY